MADRDEGGKGVSYLWRGDGRPLTPFELTVYARAGLSAVEALEWADAGIKPYQAEGFRAAGADLATALRVRGFGLDDRYLRYANERGESPWKTQPQPRPPASTSNSSTEHEHWGLGTTSLPLSGPRRAYARFCV